MQERAEEIRAAVEPVLGALGLDLYDVVVTGGPVPTVRVLVSRSGGVDLDSITAATRATSPVLDELDVSRGRYTLEVSSPGLERPLRRPEHFRGARGEQVVLKTRDAQGHVERVAGVVLDADETGVTVDVAGSPGRVALAEIESARTVFEWGAPPKAGTRAKPKNKEAAHR